MKNNYFILAGDNKHEKVDRVHFLFPMKSYCVGVKKEYDIEDIPDGSYVYVNRVLDEKSIESFKSILEYVNAKCKGIVFEDLGILELLEQEKSPLEKIFFSSHMICNTKTALAFLEETDYVVLSPDITLEETEAILHTSNKIGAFIYGHLPFMYSRRTLLKNYAKNFDLEEEKIMTLDEEIAKKRFFAVENDYGTVIYDSRVYDGRELLGKASFYILSLEFDHVESIKDFIRDFESLKEIEDSTTGFLHQKTIYKLPPKKGDKND